MIGSNAAELSVKSTQSINSSQIPKSLQNAEKAGRLTFHTMADARSRYSDVDLRRLLFDLFEAHKSAVYGAGARLLSLLPVSTAFEIGIPERPTATLPRTHRIDFASARFGVEKSAVAVGKLGQRHAIAEQPRMKQSQFADCFAKMLCNTFLLLVVDPNHASRTRATVPAPGACELQAVFVPFVGRAHAASVRNPTIHDNGAGQ